MLTNETTLAEGNAACDYCINEERIWQIKNVNLSSLVNGRNFWKCTQMLSPTPSKESLNWTMFRMKNEEVYVS